MLCLCLCVFVLSSSINDKNQGKNKNLLSDTSLFPSIFFLSKSANVKV